MPRRHERISDSDVSRRWGRTPKIGLPDPNALEAGTYNVQITDDNLCIVDTAVVISEFAPFVLSLDAVTPACNKCRKWNDGKRSVCGTGNVTIDWGGLNPSAVPAGEYTVVATDGLACTATAPCCCALPIPEPFDLTGDTPVAQGDSAAYYYEYTLGSTYDWTFSGASARRCSAFSPSLCSGTAWEATRFVWLKPTKKDAVVNLFASPFSLRMTFGTSKSEMTKSSSPFFQIRLEVVHLALLSRMSEGYTIFDGRGAVIGKEFSPTSASLPSWLIGPAAHSRLCI